MGLGRRTWGGAAGVVAADAGAGAAGGAAGADGAAEVFAEREGRFIGATCGVGGQAFSHGERAEVDARRDQLADDGLLRLDGLVGIHSEEFELGAHREVLLEHPALKDAEAFVGITRQAEVHAGLEIFQLGPAIENALERDLEAGLEEEREVGQRGEIVEAADPFPRTAADDVARVGGEHVAVAEHEIAGAQQRHELAFIAVGEVRGVNQAEGGRREKLGLFPLAGRTFHQLGGIPFAEKNLQPLLFEPAFEEIDLRGFAGTIQPLDCDQAPGKTEF